MSVQCDNELTVLHGSWFSQIHIPVTKALKFIGLYLTCNPPHIEFLEWACDLSNKTVIDWSNFIREVLIDWCEDHKEMLGGPDTVVEIDETKVGHRKYNRGRMIEGRWIFGAIQRNSKLFSMVVVPDRKAETLVNIIKTWIRPKTTIVSDGWRAYSRLNEEGFNHLVVNHSLNFVDPTTGAYTQGIERTWRDIKSYLPKYGISEDHYHGYLAECMFKRRVSLNDRFDEFFVTIAAHYPPST